MPKRSGVSPKNQSVTVQAEVREMLWRAIPPAMHDNKKSWFARAAHELGWKPRRVRAFWHCEARVVRAEEWKTLQERIDAVKAAERRHEEQTDELRKTYRDAGARLPVAR